MCIKNLVIKLVHRMGFVQIFSVVVTKEKNALCKYHDLCSYQIVQLFFLVRYMGGGGFVDSLQIYLLSIVVSWQYCHGIHNEIYSDRYYLCFIWRSFFAGRFVGK
jgi:hypothetical protein